MTDNSPLRPALWTERAVDDAVDLCRYFWRDRAARHGTDTGAEITAPWRA
jgi:hypothetical protein